MRGAHQDCEDGIAGFLVRARFLFVLLSDPGALDRASDPGALDRDSDPGALDRALLVALRVTEVNVNRKKTYGTFQNYERHIIAFYNFSLLCM